MKYIFPKIVAFLLILSGFSTLSAATYEVFMVRGDILYEGSGEQLAPSSNLASGERIKFQDKEAFAVLIGDKGLYTLSGANLGSKFKADAFVTIKSATVEAKTGQEARVQPEFKKLEDVSAFFKGAPFLVLNETQLKLNANALGLPDKPEFVLRINKVGEPVPVTKKLPFLKGILTFNGGDIASAGSPEQLSDYKLMVFLGLGQPMKEIATLDLVITDEGTFRDEISKLTEKLRASLGADNMESEDMKQHILDYLVSYYGTPEKENFESWVIEFL